MTNAGEAGGVADLVATAADDALAEAARHDDSDVGSAPTSDLIAGAAADAVAEEARRTEADPGTASGDMSGTRDGAVGEREPRAAAPPTFRVMDIEDVSLDLPSQYPSVTLVENEPPLRALVFPVGLAEGTALAQALRRMDSPRPLTHELFMDVLQRARIDIIALRITGRESGNYLAELDIMAPMGRERVTCRPSDGLVLAMRMPVAAPILVDERLLEDLGDVVPQDDY